MTTTRTTTQSHTTPVGRRVGTLVVGAGQAGLSTAFYLTRAGHDVLVLHAEARVGDHWRQRYESLLLNTPAQYDGLPGTPFPAPANTYPTGRQLGDFLERYV